MEMKSIPFNDATLSLSIKPRANIISNDILSHKSYEMFLKELGCEAQSIASFVHDIIIQGDSSWIQLIVMTMFLFF